MRAMKSVGDTSRRPQGLASRSAKLCTLLLVVLIAHRGFARYAFVGFANDGFYADLDGLWGAIQGQDSWQGAWSQMFEDQTGAQIVAATQALELQNLGQGDTLIWCYSGHGGSYTLDADHDELAGSAANAYDETIGLQNSVRPATDDELTDVFALVDPHVSIVAVLDTCHAGGFIGGLGDLDSLPNVVALLSSCERQNSYGGRPYSAFTAGLIAALGPGLPGDEDDDGMLMSNEWFRYAAASVPSIYDQDPVYWAAPGLGDVPIVIPEPATAALLLGGTLAACCRNAPRRKLRWKMLPRGGKGRWSGPAVSREAQDRIPSQQETGCA